MMRSTVHGCGAWWIRSGLHLKTYTSFNMLNENLIKGQIIELKVQIELLRYGFDVSVPNYNSSKYDLIADTGDELLRIQVKKIN